MLLSQALVVGEDELIKREEGALLDISIRGCAIRSNQPLHKGNLLHLQIRLTDQEPPIEIDAATVRTVTGRRIGLEFVKIGQEEEARLRRILMTLMHNPKEQAMAREANRGVGNPAQPLDVMPDHSMKLSDIKADTARPLILCVDDEPLTLQVLTEWLTSHEYDVLTAKGGEQAMEAIRQAKPDCILLDIMMPGMDGYALCSRLQAQDETANIPVIFVSALGGEPDKARAFALGGVDYIVKPFDLPILLDKVQGCLQTTTRWQALQQDADLPPKRGKQQDFWRFREFLFDLLQLPPAKQELVVRVSPGKLYSMASLLGIEERQIAQALATFLKLPYLEKIDSEKIRLGVLPAAYCRTHLVLATHESSGENAFVLTNPFDLTLLDSLQRVARSNQALRLYVTAPATLAPLLRTSKRPADQTH